MNSGTDEPLQDNHDDDGYMLTIRFKERPLIWIAIAILAVFVVVEGLALLTMRSSSSSQFPQPGDFHDPSDFGGENQFSPSQGSGGSSSSAVPGGDAPSSSSTPVSRTPAPGPPTAEIVTGEQAVTRVNEYLAGAGLAKADADGLLDVVNGMNSKLATLDAGLAAGEITPEKYATKVQQEHENARLGILRILGWQESTVLIESLRNTTGG